MQYDLYSYPIPLNSVFLNYKKELEMKYLIITLPKITEAVDVVSGKVVSVTQQQEWAVIVDKDGNAFYAKGCYENRQISKDTKTWQKGKPFGTGVTVK